MVAVEPLPEMLIHVRRVAPSARALEGSAESIPLGDATADVVTAAQAFHWFDHAVALPEIARVLRPAASLALVWNMREESVEWMARLGELLGSRADPARGLPVDLVASTGLFAPVERRTFPFSQRVDRVDPPRARRVAQLRGDCCPPTSGTALLAEIDRLYEEVAGSDGLTVPYETHAFRAAKAAAA